MEAALRVLAVFLEVAVLAGIIGSLLVGVKLILNDIGIGPKYNKALGIALAAVFCVITVFFTAHLASFYPTV